MTSNHCHSENNKELDKWIFRDPFLNDYYVEQFKSAWYDRLEELIFSPNRWLNKPWSHIDSNAWLPTEVWELILQHVIKQDVGNWFSYASVCKHWLQIMMTRRFRRFYGSLPGSHVAFTSTMETRHGCVYAEYDHRREYHGQRWNERKREYDGERWNDLNSVYKYTGPHVRNYFHGLWLGPQCFPFSCGLTIDHRYGVVADDYSSVYRSGRAYFVILFDCVIVCTSFMIFPYYTIIWQKFILIPCNKSAQNKIETRIILESIIPSNINVDTTLFDERSEFHELRGFEYVIIKDHLTGDYPISVDDIQTGSDYYTRLVERYYRRESAGNNDLSTTSHVIRPCFSYDGVPLSYHATRDGFKLSSGSGSDSSSSRGDRCNYCRRRVEVLARTNGSELVERWFTNSLFSSRIIIEEVFNGDGDETKQPTKTGPSERPREENPGEKTSSQSGDGDD